MVSFFRPHLSSSGRKVIAIILAFGFLAGLVLGAYVATLSDISRFSMLRTAGSSRVSISGLLCVLLLPFLFSAFAVYISQIWLLIPIAFLKAFFFSYLSSGFVLLFEGSGWLLRVLLMFTDCISMPLLCWLWFHACRSSKDSGLRFAAAAFAAVSVVGFLDCQFISPFLVNLLS